MADRFGGSWRLSERGDCGGRVGILVRIEAGGRGLMSVWFVAPSARPPEQVEPVLEMWRKQGYKIALARDMGAPSIADDLPETVFDQPYPGYAIAVNRLIRAVMAHDPTAEWFVCAGDDTHPDLNKTAEEIAGECFGHFRLEALKRALNGGADYSGGELDKLATFGVVQPTGDRWGEQRNTHAFVALTPGCSECSCRQCGMPKTAAVHLVGAYIDRVAGSPWIGREFARRMYRGNGPYWPQYVHMFGDQEIQCVAESLGVFWQRRDLIHYHDHWGRPRDGERIGHADRMPDFLKEANSAAHWDRYKGIFEARRTLGFPGSEPID